MEIVTWSSNNAPDGFQWVAKWRLVDTDDQVYVSPPDKDAPNVAETVMANLARGALYIKPSPLEAGFELWVSFKKSKMSGIWRLHDFMGWCDKSMIMQRAFYASTEEKAATAAQIGWDKMWAEYHAEQAKKTKAAKHASDAALVSDDEPEMIEGID